MNVLDAAAWGALAAASLLVGAVMALRYTPPLRITGLIMGFGAGALISAIAYELVPESLINADWQWVVAFATGAIAFYIGDAWIDRRGGKERKNIDGTRGEGAGSAIFLGTLLDGIPESLILGMGFAMGGSVSFAFLVAVFVSNIPEGVAGTVSLKSEGRAPTNIYRMWVAVAIASAVGAAIGYALVVALPNVDGSYAKAFAAGAMLTMLADAMMPEAFEHGGRTVGLVTVMGFLAAATLSALD